MTRILIADDNPQNLYMLDTLLKGNGFTTITAKNGAEALALAARDPPDLVISDILMPVMDGFELCRRWKADGRLARIPFVFYTATYTDTKAEDLGKGLGADAFFIKPMQPDALVSALRGVLKPGSSKTPESPATLSPDERKILQQYNEVLFGKLEKKVADLEAGIAERRLAEERLVRSEARYRTLYESMRDAFVRVGMDGRICEFNGAFAGMLGYSDTELPGMTYEDLTPKKWHSFESFLISTQIVPRGYSDVYEKEYQKKDGTVFPVELRTFLIRDDSGQPAGMWAIVRDISERREAEEKLRLANRKLALLNDVTCQDIKNKVTGLRGYVELVKNAGTDESRAALISREEEVLGSIHDLIAKTEEYQQMRTDVFRWIDLEKLIRTQFSLMSIDHSVTLACDLGGFEIYADPLLDRVFYNLMHNSIRHGEKITRISFSLTETSDGAMLICEDDGVGIDPENKDRIFERIVSGKGKFGLFFIREFLALSGMTIRETGTPGTGARFTISIPKGLYRFPGRSPHQE